MKIEIKRHQFQNKLNQNVVIECDSNTASYVLGNVDATWIDVTNDCGGLDELIIYLKKNSVGSRRSEKTATAQLTFIDASANLILDYLYETPCSQLNYFDVRITDEINGIVYNDFELKADNIEFEENGGCSISLPLRESNIGLNKFEKISIYDNHQKWFSEDGPKEYANFLVTKFDMQPLFQAINIGLLIFAKAITDTTALSFIFNFSIPETIRDNFGVGRYLACPTINDLIQNVCDKIGCTKVTIPQFDTDHVAIAKSGIYSNNLQYNDQGSGFRKVVLSNCDIYMAKDFLDDVCALYNCYWSFENNVLTVSSIEGNLGVEYADLTNDIVGNKSYFFDGNKKPSNGKYNYFSDYSDFQSSPIKIAYNDIVDFDGVADNPMCEGSLDKSFKFATTNFFHSKFGENNYKKIIDYSVIVSYILLFIVAGVGVWATIATITATLGAVIAGIVIAMIAIMTASVDDLRNEVGAESYYAGSILVGGSGVIDTPRIIRKDPTTTLAVSKAVVTNVSSIVKSPPNTIDYANQSWGSSIYEPLQKVWNYPLYFDAKYKGNLYELHKTTDDPFIVNLLNKSVSFYLALCKETIELLGVSNENGKIIGKVVRISASEKILVEDVEINYSNMYIKIQGRQIA
jgi:hypothetical protein